MKLTEVIKGLQRIDSQDAFWLGNCIGIAALLFVFLVVAPQKQKERKEYDARIAKAEAVKQLSAESVKAKTDDIEVVCAAASIKAGETVSKGMIVVKAVKKDKNSQHFVLKPGAAIGKISRTDLAPGAPLLDTQLTDAKQQQ